MAFRTRTVSAAGNLNLGRASNHSNACVHVVTFSGGATFEVAPKGHQGTAANETMLGYRRPWETEWTNPAVTPITADGTYVIEATGMAQVWLDFSAVGPGTVTVEGEPADG